MPLLLTACGVKNGEAPTSTTGRVQLTNLQPRTNYKAQALSVSSDLGRTLGPEIIFATQ